MKQICRLSLRTKKNEFMKDTLFETELFPYVYFTLLHKLCLQNNYLKKITVK